MTTKVEIISKETIKPSSPTPQNLRKLNLAFLDQIMAFNYIPLSLFYTSSQVKNMKGDFNTISNSLKKSLSKTLSSYYPLSGRLDGIRYVDCNDEGALYVEARANINLSQILENREINVVRQLLPFDPYRVYLGKKSENLGIQLNHLECGGICISVCLSHHIADASTLVSFMTAWAKTAIGDENYPSPSFEAATLFPAIDLDEDIPHVTKSDIKIAAKRFEFSPKNLSILKSKFSNLNPTSIEALTALIWKSALATTKPKSSIACHAINIRPRMIPPLPEHSFGNLLQFALAPLIEPEKELGLDELGGLVKESIAKINGEYLSEVQGEVGVEKAWNGIKQEVVPNGGVDIYLFSSWTRFPLYEMDFGFGNPTWVCTTHGDIKNVFYFMDTKCGGIEVLAHLVDDDMVEFEKNQELLQYVSSSTS